MRQDRGSIVKIQLDIEYPDGTTRHAEYGKDWIEKSGAILFHESCMTPEQEELYKGGDDWKFNPTFLRWERTDIENQKARCLGRCHRCYACQKD